MSFSWTSQQTSADQKIQPKNAPKPQQLGDGQLAESTMLVPAYIAQVTAPILSFILSTEAHYWHTNVTVRVSTAAPSPALLADKSPFWKNTTSHGSTRSCKSNPHENSLTLKSSSPALSTPTFIRKWSAIFSTWLTKTTLLSLTLSCRYQMIAGENALQERGISIQEVILTRQRSRCFDTTPWIWYKIYADHPEECIKRLPVQKIFISL